jgi:hypothetical protein
MHCLFLSYIAGHVDLLGFFINTQSPLETNSICIGGWKNVMKNSDIPP